MARFLPKIFTLVRWTSQVLLICSALLWMTSYWRQALFFYKSAHRDPMGSHHFLYVTVVNGRFYTQYSGTLRKQEYPGRWVPREFSLTFKPIEPPWDGPRLSDLWRFMWISEYHEYPRQQGYLRGLTFEFPFWLVVAAFAVLPGTSTISRARRRRRVRSGRCSNCGYDVRGSGDRCPECGTPIDRAAAARADSDSVASMEVRA